MPAIDAVRQDPQESTMRERRHKHPQTDVVSAFRRCVQRANNERLRVGRRELFGTTCHRVPNFRSQEIEGRFRMISTCDTKIDRRNGVKGRVPH